LSIEKKRREAAYFVDVSLSSRIDFLGVGFVIKKTVYAICIGTISKGIA